MTVQALPVQWGRWIVALALTAFLGTGLFGAYRYVENYWLYRGFAPPRDAPFVRAAGSAVRIYVASPALGGRRQPVDVYLPPGYATHPHRRYPVLYLLHGTPGRPGAFLATVRMGVVEDELVALHRARPLILVMPFGSTGTFTDKEWANGVGRNERWETFVARDVVEAVDAHYRTIRSGRARGIGGLSEGGYGALNIALHHPREFHVVESWSGYERAADIGSIFGHRAAILRRNSPELAVTRVARGLRARHVSFFFYVGHDDRELAQNRAFAGELAQLGLRHRFYVVRGGHDWSIWRGNAARAYLAASKGLRDA